MRRFCTTLPIFSVQEGENDVGVGEGVEVAAAGICVCVFSRGVKEVGLLDVGENDA